MLKILIYGAGVIGSLFAGKLASSGYDISVLSRGSRYTEILNNGILLRQSNSNRVEKYRIKLIDYLENDDVYDYIIVCMQKTQVEDIIPILSRNNSPNIVFVVNNALGYDNWSSAIGKDRLMVGFPSAGGMRKDGIVEYFIGKGIIRMFQTTTFGEINGSSTKRLNDLVSIFSSSGIPAVESSDMDSWQKTHIAIVTSIANALYKYQSDNYKLSNSYRDIYTMIKSIKEGLNVIQKLGYRITPFKLNYFRLPAWMITLVMKPIMGTKLAEVAMAKHTIVAKPEMKQLQKEFDFLINMSMLETPNIHSLRNYLLDL